jgi:ATP-dependent RNA helicase RhlE
VHRIGRTARAGASGIAYSFCDVEERAFLRDIERLIKLHVPVIEDHPFLSTHATPQPTDFNRRGGPRAQAPRPQNSERQQQGQGNGSRPSQAQRPRNGNGRSDSRPQNGQGERRSNPPPQAAQGEPPQNTTPRPQAAQPARANRQQGQGDRAYGERRNDQPRDNRTQGERPKFGNGSFNPQSVHPRDDSRAQTSRPAGEANGNGQSRDNRTQGSRPSGQRPNGNGAPQGNGERRNDSRPQYNSSRPQRDNGAPSDAPALPTTPVRRKRPLPPPDQREQPVLTDRFGNPLPMKPKPVTTPGEE